MIKIYQIKKLSIEKKAAIVFVLATAISSGLNMLTTPLFTRLMPVASFGTVQLYNTWYQVLWVFSTFSVTNAVVNVGFHDYPKDRMGFLSSSLGLSSLCTLFFAFVVLLFRHLFESYSGLNISLIILMIMSFLFLNSTQLWICLSRYELKYKTVFWVIALSAIFSSLISLLAVYKTTDNYAEVRLWTQHSIQLIVGLFLFVFIIVKGKKFFNKQYWLFILTFNAPLLIHYLSQFILSSSDRLMIKFYSNESDVAIYSLAYLASNIMMVFFSPINSVIIPRTHQLMDDRNYSEVENFLYKLLFFIGGIVFVISLFSPEIISILGGNQYKDGIKIVPIISASTLFTILYLYVANIEFLYGKTTRIAFMTIIAAILNIVLNSIFLPLFGFSAAAYTTLISYIVYAWLHVVNMNKLVGVQVFSNIKLSIICAIIVGLCMSTILLPDFYFLRYTIFIIIILIAIFYRKKILKAF